MDAKRLFSMVLPTSSLGGCAQPPATPTPTPAFELEDPLADPVGHLCLDSTGRIHSTFYRIIHLDDMSGAGMTVYSSIGLDLLYGTAVATLGRPYLSDINHDRIVRMDDMNGAIGTTFP